MPMPEEVRYSGLSFEEAFELCRMKAKELHDGLDKRAFLTNDGHVTFAQRTSDEIKALAAICETHAQAIRDMQRARR